jgi:mgtE-like transporter
MNRLFWKILKESLGVLVFASLLSSIGGFGIEDIRKNIIFLLPLLILMPALNDMTGDYGGIIASRFTTMLYMGRVKAARWWKSHLVHRLFGEVFIIGTLSAVYISALASVIAWLTGFEIDFWLFSRILAVVLATTWVLIVLQFFVCILGGFYVYRKKHDPDNYLIPISTGLADLCSMLILSLLVRMLF